MRAHGLHVETRFVVMQPEARGLAHGLGRLARRDESLGRNAAVVEAIAAHLALLDEDDLNAHGRRSGGHGKPARSRADHAQVWTQDFRHQRFLFRQAV